MDGFLIFNNQFKNYSTEHLVSVIVFIIIGIMFIYLGRDYLRNEARHRFIILLMLFIFLVQLAKIPVYIYAGIFDYREHLPLHLCNISPVFMLFAYFFRNRLAWSVFFLWIMAGTFQSLFTPTLTESFPHFEWWRYWIIHVWLVTGAFYGILVLGYKMRFKDIFYGF